MSDSDDTDEEGETNESAVCSPNKKKRRTQVESSVVTTTITMSSNPDESTTYGPEDFNDATLQRIQDNPAQLALFQTALSQHIGKLDLVQEEEGFDSKEFLRVRRVLRLLAAIVKSELKAYKGKELTIDLFRALTSKLERDEFQEKLANARRVLKDPLNDTDKSEDKRLTKLEGVIEEYLENLKKRNETARESMPRVVAIDYHVSDTELHFKHDYNCFAKHVDNLFTWFQDSTDKKKGRHKYLAPYFPVIQSSGMGKTKLLYEYHNNQKQHNKSTVLVLCSYDSETLGERPNIYFTTMSFGRTEMSVSNRERKSITDKLNALVENLSGDVVLLFDEAQKLLENDGFAFRCIRWWLCRMDRIKRDEDKRQVVAVFAGTTCRLADLFREEEPATSSRDVGKTPMYNAGKDLYEPFYKICTTGVLRKHIVRRKGATDLEIAAEYGRPLFAILAIKNELTKCLDSIRKRILLGEKEEAKGTFSPMAYLSVLAIRLQMGQTSVGVASELIAAGYTNLTHFSHDAAAYSTNLCVFPDPVCAYLAMLIMMVSPRFPEAWAQIVANIFSSGLCHPNNGKVGHVAAALYLLLCGDVLRKANHNYSSSSSNKPDTSTIRFAVPFWEWIKLLAFPKLAWCSEDHDETMLSATNHRQQQPRVSFIQICRNYLQTSLQEMVRGDTLKEWFEAGLAFYAHPNCPAYDMIASVGCQDAVNGNTTFCPLLIKVKTRMDYTQEQITQDLVAMETLLQGNNIYTGYCVVLLTGMTQPFENSCTPACMEINVHRRQENDQGQYHSVAIAVPKDDCFGIWKLAATTTTTAGGDISEVYISHALLYSSSSTSIAASAVDSSSLSPPQVMEGNMKKVSSEADNLLHSLKDSFDGVLSGSPLFHNSPDPSAGQGEADK